MISFRRGAVVDGVTLISVWTPQAISGVTPTLGDSVRTKIREALVLNLQKITTANGYNTDIGEVLAEPRSFADMINWPVVNVYWGRETYSHIMGYFYKDASAYLDVFVKDVNAIYTTRQELLADIEKLLLTNYYLPDASNDATCIDCHVTGDTIWGFEDTPDYSGFTVELKIRYKQNILNPELTTQGTLTAGTNLPPASIAVSWRENIRAALLYNLTRYTAGSDYHYTMNNSPNPVAFQAGIANYPFVNIISEKEVDSYNHDQLINKELDYVLEYIHGDVNTPNQAIEDMLADAEKSLMAYYYLPDSTGKRTCVECWLTYNEPFLLHENTPTLGIDLGVKVFYRQSLLNPSAVV